MSPQEISKVRDAATAVERIRNGFDGSSIPYIILDKAIDRLWTSARHHEQMNQAARRVYYCAVCGQNAVDAVGGFDTCKACAAVT